MDVLTTILGATLILAVFRDIFQELFNPNGYGRVSHWVQSSVWRVAKRYARGERRKLALAGPIGVLLIIVMWIVLTATGWALILWSHLPDAFVFSSDLELEPNNRVVTALYLSVVTLTTLGYGDIAPKSELLRLLLPLEGIAGFVLLTATVTWMLSLYPILDRRRALAHMIALLYRSEFEPEHGVSPDDALALESLTEQLISAEGDLHRFPITYYFHEDDETRALPYMMPKLLDLARKKIAAQHPPLRQRAQLLHGALEDFAATLVARGFVKGQPESVDEVLRLYARDHLVESRPLSE